MSICKFWYGSHAHHRDVSNHRSAPAVLRQCVTPETMIVSLYINTIQQIILHICVNYSMSARQCIISGHASFASVTYQPQAVIKSILVLNSHCINIMYLEEGGKKVACWDSGRGGTLWGDGFEKEETRCVDWLREIGETRC